MTLARAILVTHTLRDSSLNSHEAGGLPGETHRLDPVVFGHACPYRGLPFRLIPSQDEYYCLLLSSASTRFCIFVQVFFFSVSSEA